MRSAERTDIAPYPDSLNFVHPSPNFGAFFRQRPSHSVEANEESSRGIRRRHEEPFLDIRLLGGGSEGVELSGGSIPRTVPRLAKGI